MGLIQLPLFFFCIKNGVTVLLVDTVGANFILKMYKYFTTTVLCCCKKNSEIRIFLVGFRS